MHYTHWNIPSGPTVVPEALTAAGCSPLLAALLHARGIDTPEKARDFLDCGPGLLRDPFELKDMEKAASRLRAAIDRRETVAVYGDYDVDGITSSCMLTDYLRRRGVPTELYIPDRIEEGYGVNAAAIEALHGRGVTLIVTVDCGVTTAEEADFARSLGVDMIITDHHECRERLPEAAAVVDPKRPDNGDVGRDLAGVGVAFKLLCALEGDAEAVLDRYADLVAVGTVADVMPLLGENRRIVRRGLEKLSADPQPGLRSLIREAGVREERITASNVGFTLAPRLNASGRLGQVQTAVELLLSTGAEEAAQSARALCELNSERQRMEKRIWDEALEMLGDARPDGPIVLAGEGWHQGVIGIVASRLTETFCVPAVMICLDGDRGKGSCRSCGGFNLFEALSACQEHLEGFGGHALAAGLTISRGSIDAFREALADYYRRNPAAPGAVLDIDINVDAPELLRMDSVEDLERLEPCGAGNPRPMLSLLGAACLELSPIGGGKHLRVRLEKQGQVYEGVFFSHTAQQLGLKAGDTVDAAFTPQINVFRSRRSVQLLLCDLRAHDDAAAREYLGGTPRNVPRALLPEREDFVLLWRALGCGECRGTVNAVWMRLAPELREETFCLCLRVFGELGLLTLDYDGTTLHVQRCAGAEKTALERSELLQRLRREAV